MMGVTIKDVAKRVGVATSTVSRVLKDSPNISEKTKEEVRMAIKELGYVPNVAAQNLAMRKTKNIGLILPPMDTPERTADPFFMTVVSEISRCLNEDGYTATMAANKTTDELVKTIRLMHQNKRVDGFILLYSIENDPILNYLLDEKVPFVMLGTPFDRSEAIRYIDNDNLALGKTATQFLIEQGHERILFAGQNHHEFVLNERYNGYREVMEAHGLNAEPFFELTQPSEVDRFMKCLEKNQPTAMVVSNDIFAVKLIPFLATMGLNVGGNFSLISMNNSIFATLSHPYLTTVDIHTQELARKSAEVMVEALEKEDFPITNTIIPYEIVVRETTPEDV